MKTELEIAKETIEELKLQLFEASCIIDAIKEGAIDALVVNKGGYSGIYSLESADFTYRMLIEKSGEGALSISPAGLVVYCNECFAQLIGLPAGKIIGTYFNSYIDSVGKFQQLKQELQAGPSKGEIVLNIDGRRVPVYASLTDLSPQVSAIGIIITDLSEKRRQEDSAAAYRKKLENRINELTRTNFSLEQFIHLIRNDIKEPLRKIISYSNLLSSKGQNGFDAEELQKLRLMNNAANKISSMLSDSSRYTLNVHHSDASEVDLNGVMKEVTDDIAMLIEERKAKISSKTLPLVKGSPLQMHLLFLNLLDNAIRFTKDGAHPAIKITTDVEDCVDMRRPNKKFYRIDVHNQNVDLSRSMLPNGRDFQLNAFMDGGHLLREGEETVLSLAICKNIMENHSGKLECVEADGRGCVFRLYFPLTS